MIQNINDDFKLRPCFEQIVGLFCRGERLLFLTLLTATLALTMATSSYAQNSVINVPNVDMESLTQSLVSLNARFQRANTAAQPQQLAQLMEMAARRQAMLAELALENPGEILRLALSTRLRSRLPQEVRDMVEQRVKLEGTLEVHIKDYDDGSYQIHHALKTELGEQFSLHFADTPSEAFPSNRIRIEGVLLDAIDVEGLGGALVIQGGEDSIQYLTDEGTVVPVASNSQALSLENTFGEQRTAVLLVNFTQQPEEPWTIEDAQKVVFGDVSDFIRENSYGQTWLAGDVFGWLTIDVDIDTCPTMNIAQEAQRAVEAQGVDLSGYKRFLYAFPDIGCNWAGESTTGSYPSHAWFDGTLMRAETVTHEVGHSFGLLHSHALECGPHVHDDACASIEYGDVLDRMGGSASGHFNAFQKQRLGWLGTSNSPAIVDADVSDTFTLEPYALTANGPKTLRILKDIDAQTGGRRWYYLEYRQAVGFDSFLSTSRYGQSVLNGVVLRIGTENQPNSSYLLDMTPDTQKYDWDDLALTVGDTYMDAASGVAITADWVDSTGATLIVDFGEPQCVRANPQITVLPLQSTWLSPGATFSYDLMITNTDNQACTETQFNLSTVVPSSWNAVFDNESLFLAPGVTGSTMVTVTSDINAADGFYDFIVTAQNQVDLSYASTASATYIVSAEVTNSPPEPIDDTATTSMDTPVIIDILANDFDPDGDPLILMSVNQGNHGTASVNTNGTVTYLPNVRFKGTDTFSYRVSDGGTVGEAMVSVTVRKNGGQGRGRKK